VDNSLQNFVGDVVKYRFSSIMMFFLLVIVLSIPFWVLGILYPVEILPGLPIGSLMIITPTMAAIIMSYRKNTFIKTRQLLCKVLDFKRIKNKNWYFIYILFNPIVAIVALLLIILSGTTVSNGTPITIAVIPMFISFFIAALLEEIGWTGYVTDPLLHKYGIIRTGLLIGFIWVIFHVVVLIQASRSFEWICWWTIGAFTLRILMVWLYTNSGKSVFAATLFHAMINLSWQLFPINGSFYDPKTFSLVTLVLGVLLIKCYKPIIE